MSTAFWLILTASLQVTLLSAVALLIHRVSLRNRPRDAARLMAFSSLLMLFLSVAIVLPLPSWFSEQSSAREDSAALMLAQTDEAQQPIESQSTSNVESSELPINMSLPPLTLTERLQSFSQQLEGNADNENAESLSWLVTGIKVAGIGIAFLLLVGVIRFCAGLIALRRLKSASTKMTCPSIVEMTNALCETIGCQRKIEIYCCKDLTTAATVGSLRPHIFLSEDFGEWEHSDQQSVLAHEIAHIHHRDFEANIVCQVCRVIHFFNPAVQWLAAQMRLQQELAADRVAAQVTSGPTAYSRTLASLALRQDDMKSPMVSMFLPQENNFIQRIKMLQKQTPNNSLPTSRLVPFMTLALAVAICGIRLPASAVATPAIVATEDEDPGFDLSWIPGEGSIACMRPERLLKAPMFSKLLEKIPMFEGIVNQQNKSFENATGLATEHISESIAFSGSSTDLSQSFYIYRTYEDNLENFKSLGEIVGQDKRFPMMVERKGNSAGLNNGMILDEKTILWSYSKDAIEKARSYGSRKPFRAPWFKQFEKVQKQPVVVTFRGADLKVVADGMFGQILSPKSIETMCKCRSLVLSIDVKNQIDCGFVFDFANAADASALEKVLPETREKLNQILRAFSNDNSQWRKVLSKAGLEAVESMKVARSGQRLEVSTSLNPDMEAFSDMADEMRTAARRTQGMNNMRQLALGLLNYESAYGSLPKATMRSESGHEYSWRIAILPFIEQNEMYQSYRFDEPWNSKHNQQLTSKMPALFKHPESESETDTNFFVVVGPGTLFPPEGKVKFSDAEDGSMRTVLLVEAIRDSHWAKPGGIPLDQALEPGTLGGFTEGVIYMNMLDGSVRGVSDEITPAMLASLYSLAGGETDIALSNLALEMQPPANEKQPAGSK